MDDSEDGDDFEINMEDFDEGIPSYDGETDADS